jgi:tetratricopeptide (TPR) repeat protein
MNNNRILQIAVVAAIIATPLGLGGSVAAQMSPLSQRGPGAQAKEYATPAMLAVGNAIAESGVVYDRGVAEEKAGNTDAAIADFKQSVKMWQDQRDAWYRMGNIAEAKGDTKGAISAFLSGIYLPEKFNTETNPYWLFHCANLLWKAGRHEKAIAVYNEGEYQFNYERSGGTITRRHFVLLPHVDDSFKNDKRFAALCEIGMGMDDSSSRDILTNEVGELAHLKAATQLDPTLAEAHFFYGYELPDGYRSQADTELKLATALGNADVAGKADAWLHRNQWPKDIDVTPVDTVPPPSARNIP